ncbi:MAG TPA: alpha/beta fold hydrolase [Bacillota bacterium]|nr:alpha/beta fold hydrolase [Bacillota bacterium]
MQQIVELVVEGKKLRGMYHCPEAAPGKIYPTVILYHGLFGSKLEPHRIFLKLSRQLEAKGIATLRFDFSGSGESDGDSEEMTFFSELKEAGAILDYAASLPATDTNRIGVLGYSLGGAVAAVLAGNRNRDIKALVLWSPGTDSSIREYLRPILESSVIDSKGSFDLFGDWLNAGFYEEIGRWDIIREVQKFENQVLIVHGSYDQTIPVETAFKYYQALPGRSRLKIIDGADHTFNRYDWGTGILKQTTEFLTEILAP